MNLVKNIKQLQDQGIHIKSLRKESEVKNMIGKGVNQKIELKILLKTKLLKS